MPTKYYLHGLTNKQKSSSYIEEMFGDFSEIKFRICGVIVGITIIDWLLGNTLMSLFSTSDNDNSFLPELSLLIAAIAIYVLSYLPYWSKILKSKLLKFRIVSNSLAGTLFGIYILLMEIKHTGTALETNQEENWIKAHTCLFSSIYIILIVNLLTPMWYMKLFLPGCYYLGGTIAYIRISHPLTGWIAIRNAVSFIYVILITLMISKNSWQMFLRRLNVDTWNHVYKYILDRNPSCIAIMDPNGKVVYSNTEFTKNATDANADFFKRITHIRMRNFGTPMSSPKAGMVSMSFNSEESKNLLNINLQNVSGKFGADYTENNIQQNFENLHEVLLYYLKCLVEKKLENADHLIFDGKMTLIQSPESPVSYEIIIQPLLEYQRIILILNNTTERDSIAALENNNEYKNQLLASVSHELRTPLNGNLGLLQAALNDYTIPEIAKNNLLFPAFRSGRLLSHLMNDLLDYSHLLTDNLVLSFESKSLKETFEYCYQLLEDAFASKDLTFHITLDERLPALFRTDHNRLTQIILNLLTNALKFTMKGSVTIEVEFVDNSYAAIQVTDTGIGIKQEDVYKLFEEETSLPRYSFRKEAHSKGVGLGLKVTNRLAKLLGSENKGIQVKSVPDQDSCFSFTVLHMAICIKLNDPLPVLKSITIPDIPLEYLDQADRAPSQTMASYSKQKWTFYKKKTTHTTSISSTFDALQKPVWVLIVDDDQFNILALESQLSQFGLFVDSANNGKQALEKIRSQPNFFKLIFMDCQMPIMDGYEATRHLVHDMDSGKLPRTTIIGCTAFTDKDRITECLRCGMKQVIHKPVMKNNLEKVLKDYADLL